jgi:hypothetical protein
VPKQFWIAEIQISDEMEHKIRTRRFVTGSRFGRHVSLTRTTMQAISLAN